MCSKLQEQSFVFDLFKGRDHGHVEETSSYFWTRGTHELRKIAERFEEKIYSAATSQMLTMETKSFNAATNSLPSNSAGHSKKSPNDKKSPTRKKALRSRDRVVCQHLDLDDVVPRPHWMTLCTHECLFNMQADGPRFDERSCEGLVATQADSKRHAN
ncbi:hypothetical protein CK203_066064 [Vitis vinifera]|uniref:Mediator complex subunit 15 KIX domain-containing protein n=1 Tax=Vitis vinifera TaxID=29760 RepID=A0A438FS77_VITVI|nr:hypothetical protein CK203_066064 [Vitis vinifera]